MDITSLLGGILLCASLSLAWSGQAQALTFSLETGIPGESVFLASPLGEWDPSLFQLKEARPGHYELTLRDPWLWTLPYKFVVNGRWILDPRNPKTIPDGNGNLNSLRELPPPPDPEELGTHPSSESFRLYRLRLSDFQGSAREVLVLHGPSRGTSDTVYVQDGSEFYVKTGVHDLIARAVHDGDARPATLVFLSPLDRLAEYDRGPAAESYRRFVAERVVPEVEKRWPTGRSRGRRILFGISLGGLTSLALALERPDLFSRVCSLSGAFGHSDGWIFSRVQDYQGLPLRVDVHYGIYEGPRFVKPNLDMIRLLTARGFLGRTGTFPGVHDWPSWRLDGPRHLLGLTPSSEESRD